MEPTTAELAAKVGIRTLCDWAGVARDGGSRASLLEALGEPVALRDLGLVTEVEYEAVVTGLMITAPPVAQAAHGAATMATPLQRARARMLRCGARAALGLPSEIVPLVPTAGAVAPPAAVAPAAGAGHKKVKLSSLVDGAADAERMFSEHGTCLGKSPYQEPVGSGLRG